MEGEKRIFMDQNDYGKRKAVCRHAAGFMAAVMLAAAGQPSMAYASEKLQINDPSASEQWAFFNDGSFTSEEVTKYPVYSDPFGQPSENTELLGTLVEVKKRQAVSGVDINLKQAWETYGNGSHDTIVAMIDTGIDASHEDLKDTLWVNTDEIPGNGIDDDGNGYVDDCYGWNFYNNNNQIFTGNEDSHGTHGAGTISAGTGNGIGISGIVPGTRVRVMALKALGGNDGGGSTAAVIKAIKYAEDNGAVICNLSLTSTTDDKALYEAMKNSGMLFVVAAGNGDPKTGKGVDTDMIPFYPAAYDLDNIISVANLSFDGALSASSNYGKTTVDLAAPGSYILSTTPGNTYGYMSGTSMAAPMVSGAAAMIYSYFDGIGVADVKEILMSTVTPMESLKDVTVSGGMLNVGAALSYDIGSLSRRGFQNGGTRPANGTAPYLEMQTSNRNGGMYLTVRVLDIDGDLDKLFYAKGEHTAGEFANGTVEGTAFTVNEKDMAAFQITEKGTYTFYAVDKNGNGAVKIAKFVSESDGPGAFQ